MHPGNYPYSRAKAVVDIHGGKLARVYTNGNGNRCRVTSADIELIPDASGVTYFAADKTLVTGCSWLNPASGATYRAHCVVQETK
ncbi:hypothetical protein HCN71_10255 [Klebsiella pneumoniae]|uniref:hypothetical protein n=1 Tax=Klebsiella pneumoniae TaxID=573 RepID=UPI0014613DB2|nr:hypothetical protein [Klebsiella pneumoniae]NMR55387.1 hypothetical protein [Klebsiella pneumoniae]